MGEAEFNRITAVLDAAEAGYQVTEHEAVRTSAEAAAARGARLSQGIKALVVKFTRPGKPQDFYAVVNIPADRKLDWKKAKAILQANEVRFATEQEVVEKTGCEPGGVPPFGHAQQLAILVDPSLFEEKQVEFNAGLTTKSIRVGSEGLKRAFDACGAAYFSLSA